MDDARRLEERLRRAPVPEAAAAEDRARRVVAAAAAGLPGRPRPRRLAPVAVALAVAAALAAAVAAGPHGEAVASWVTRLMAGTPPASAPRPALGPLPAPGRLLVTGPGGAWVVHRDGSRRRLGPYGDVAWSPRGLFVAATRDRTLLAVEPGGAVRWALGRPRPVHDPRWSPTGYRIAYRTDGAMRVVAGDGSGDHLLVRGVAPVPPAWRPGRATHVALARRGGGVEVWAADSPKRLRRLAVRAPVALAWTPDGRRLAVARRRGVTVFDARGRPIARQALGGVTGAALAPGGRRVAVAHGGTVSLVPIDGTPPRVLWSGPQRVDSVTWSPDGRVLVAASRAGDQWVFLPVRRPGRVVADAGIAAQFDPSRRRPRGFPAVAGWAP